MSTGILCTFPTNLIFTCLMCLTQAGKFTQVKPPYISHLSLEELPDLLKKFDTGNIRGRAIVKMD